MTSKDQQRTSWQWLSQLFGNDQIPEFEKNTQTIELLHELSIISLRNESNAQLYVEDLKRKADEYNADAHRLEALMGRLSMGQNSYSPKASSHTRGLAQIGALIGVKNASNTSFMLSLQDLNSDLHQVTVKMQDECKANLKLSKRMQGLLIKHSSLKKALEDVEKKSTRDVGQLKTRKKEIDKLKETAEISEQKISKLKTELAKTGLSESYYHDRLVKKKEKLDSLHEELVPLQAKLQSYATLPPNDVEAKVKIAELKIELDELKAQMSECVGASGI